MECLSQEQANAGEFIVVIVATAYILKHGLLLPLMRTRYPRIRLIVSAACAELVLFRPHHPVDEVDIAQDDTQHLLGYQAAFIIRRYSEKSCRAVMLFGDDAHRI